MIKFAAHGPRFTNYISPVCRNIRIGDKQKSLCDVCKNSVKSERRYVAHSPNQSNHRLVSYHRIHARPLVLRVFAFAEFHGTTTNERMANYWLGQMPTQRKILSGPWQTPQRLPKVSVEERKTLDQACGNHFSMGVKVKNQVLGLSCNTIR